MTGTVYAMMPGQWEGRPVLLLGGDISRAGNFLSTSRVVAWEGADWSLVGGPGNPFGTVWTFELFDDGNGPALHAGLSGGTYLVKWNGSAWVSVGGGVNGHVRDLCTFDDGSGPALYVAGSFTTVGSQPIPRIARWNGQAWSAVGGGITGTPSVLAAHDDGSGPALYVGGSITAAGALPVSGLARWRSGAWESIGDATHPTLTPSVYSLESITETGGPALYASGTFTSAGGIPAQYIARWDGASWAALGDGLPLGGAVLATYDDGSGPALHAAAQFATSGQMYRVASWGDGAWSFVGADLPHVPRAMAVFDEGRGPALFVAGQNYVRKHRARGWATPGTGPDAAVRCIADADGPGPGVYIGGSFTSALGASGSVVHVDVEGGSGIAPAQTLVPSGAVRAFEVIDGVLYAAGTSARFPTATGWTWCASRWDGHAWHALASPTSSDYARDTAQLDGQFLIAGQLNNFGMTARVAAWDGQFWEVLGGPAGSISGYAVCIHNDGTGDSIYASVDQYVLRWSGSQWQGFGGTNGRVHALTSFDDGGGARLYAGGDFAAVNGIFMPGVACWDGAQWSGTGFPGIPGPDGGVAALEVIQDSSGPALYAVGSFVAPSGSGAPQYIARYDGASWSHVVPVNGPVYSIARVHDAQGPAIYIGGNFTLVNGRNSFRLVRLGCPAPAQCYANCDASTAAPILNVADFTCFLQRFAAGDSYANCDASTIAPVLNVADFTCFLQGFAAGCR